MDGLSEKTSDLVDKISDGAGPAKEKVGDAAEKLAESELVKQLKEGICSVGDLLTTFGSKEAAEKFGEEFAGKMKTHAEALKEKGEQFCDCDACVKAREILKDLGEDITEKAAELKAGKDAGESAEEPAEPADNEAAE